MKLFRGKKLKNNIINEYIQLNWDFRLHINLYIFKLISNECLKGAFAKTE